MNGASTGSTAIRATASTRSSARFDRAESDPELDPGAPRGDGGVHGVRAREVHGRGRRLPGDLRARRDPSAERPLRREARPPAGASRSSASRRARRSAGTTSRRSTCRRSSRTSRTSTCRWRSTPAQIRHLVDRAHPDRARPAHGHVPDHPERRAAELTRSETPPHEHGTIHSSVGWTRRRAIVPDERRPAARRRDPERRREGRDARRRRARCGAADEVIEVAEMLGAGVAKALLGKAVAARRPAVRDRLDRAARHEAELGPDEGLRHAADGRLELPVLRVPARGGPGARRADRHRRADARHPLPDGGAASSATRRRRCER